MEDTIQTQNDIVVLYDIHGANPNGNPLADNRPRQDTVTNEGIITDVRLKRFIRDQLADEGHGIYLANVRQDDEDATAPTREYLAEQIMQESDTATMTAQEITELFLDGAIDTRLFGATFSFSVKDSDDRPAADFASKLPNQLTGPVQFTPGRSLHPVLLNENYDRLSSIVATEENNQQGGFDQPDYRIQYGMYAFNGVVDATRAAKTRLTDADVRAFENAMWRSLKQQTTTRSKFGHAPQCYIRVEYDDKWTNIGLLGNQLTLDSDRSADFEELRRTRDAVVVFDDLLDLLGRYDDRIKTVHVKTNPMLRAVWNDDEGTGDDVYGWLEQVVGEDSVNRLTPETPTDA